MNWLFSPLLRPLVLLAAAASLLLNLAMLMPAMYMLQVFDRVFASRSVETLTMLTLLALLSLALGACMDRLRAHLLARAAARLDATLAAPALQATLAAAARGRRDDAQPVHDVARLRAFLGSPAVLALFDAPWLPLYLLVITALHPALGIAALTGAAAIAALGIAGERALRRPTLAALDDGRRAGRQAESLAAQAEALVGLGMLGAAVARWQRLHGAALGAQQQAAERGAQLAAAGRALRQAVQIALLALGAWLVVAGHASPGLMVAATLLLGRALQPVEQLLAGWKALIEVRGAWQRLAAQPLDEAAPASVALPAPAGLLELERAGLQAADGRPILRPLILRVEAGECLGVVGPSGAGKTSLLRLMLGLRTPDAGSVRLDGAELALWQRAGAGHAPGYLPQDVQLLPGTVAENIARFGPVDAAAVRAAAQRAGIEDLIARLPQAYDTEVGDGGCRLSGGQRQRIGLARALYGAPRLVVLDEPDAALDADGEQALRATLAALKQDGCTVVLVSHRLALMRHVDRVALLRDGQLEAVGPRDAMFARLAGAAAPGVPGLPGAPGIPGRTVQPLRAAGAAQAAAAPAQPAAA